MKQLQTSTWLLIAVGSVSTCVVGAGVWRLASGGSAEAASTLPKELTYESLKAQTAEPGKVMDTMRAAMRRDDLTDEQRREAGGNMRKLWREIMHERVESYFAADVEDRDAILDQHIDDFMARMKQWEKRREEIEKLGEDGKQNEESPMRRMFGSMTQQDRKERSESRNPDEMARTMAYFSAVQKRMTERGIKMPSRGRGSRGGRGFGP